MSTIRVLVVDDSALIRQMLTRALDIDPRIEVVGSARNGVEAIEKVRDLRPDVVTLDIQMPEMDGLEALPFIMKDSPARVLMLSSLDDPDTTYQALQAGAVDFVPKPRQGFATELSELSEHLIRKIKTAYRIAPEKRMHALTPTHESLSPPTPLPFAAPEAGPHPVRLVVMVASTGGPPALEQVFAGLPGDLGASYLVVQHLPAGFTQSLAGRLGRVSGLSVVEAEAGMDIETGAGYVAPHGAHMRVQGVPGRRTRIALNGGRNIHGVKPSADPLFESAADQFGHRVIGVVLTGMGADGARGMQAIVEAGGRTIAQDEDSSVVWGMPSAAIKLGAVQSVVPLDRIAAEIRRSVREGR